MYHPRSIYSSRPTHSYHFQADLNWCDGTFKGIIFIEKERPLYFQSQIRIRCGSKIFNCFLTIKGTYFVYVARGKLIVSCTWQRKCSYYTKHSFTCEVTIFEHFEDYCIRTIFVWIGAISCGMLRIVRRNHFLLATRGQNVPKMKNCFLSATVKHSNQPMRWLL